MLGPSGIIFIKVTQDLDNGQSHQSIFMAAREYTMQPDSAVVQLGICGIETELSWHSKLKMTDLRKRSRRSESYLTKTYKQLPSYLDTEACRGSPIKRIDVCVFAPRVTTPGGSNFTIRMHANACWITFIIFVRSLAAPLSKSWLNLIHYCGEVQYGLHGF
jgi:hypothetical protein